MPGPLDPAAVAQRWASNLSNSTQKITASVNALTTSPTSLAAQASATWLARLNDPNTKTKFENSLNRVTLAQWQQTMLQKGIPRISSGAQQAIPKMTAFLTQWLPYEQAGSQTVRRMPNATLADRIQRAVAMINYNAQFKRT